MRREIGTTFLRPDNTTTMKKVLIFLLLCIGSLPLFGQHAAWYYNQPEQAEPQQPMMWYEANDVDGDGNKANNPSDGSTISTWHDKSGNNYDLTVKTGSEAEYYGSEYNGNATLRFDNSLYYITDVSAMDNVKDYTFMFATKTTSFTSNYLFAYSTDGCNWVVLTYYTSTSWSNYGKGATCSVTNKNVNFNTFNTMAILQQNWTNDTQQLDVKTSGGDNSTDVITNMNEVDTHKELCIGGYNTVTALYEGDVSEVLIFSPALSTEDESYWENYLYSKYIE
jgi:hypothetical protein